MPAPDLNSIKKSAACLSLKFYDNITPGELAERSNAAVLKTVEPKGSRGSNPLLSAIKFPLQKNTALKSVSKYIVTRQTYLKPKRKSLLKKIISLAIADLSIVPVSKGFYGGIYCSKNPEQQLFASPTMPGPDNLAHALFGDRFTYFDIVQTNDPEKIKIDSLEQVAQETEIYVFVYKYIPETDETVLEKEFNQQADKYVVIRENGFGHYEQCLPNDGDIPAISGYSAPEVAYRTYDDGEETDEDDLDSLDDWTDSPDDEATIRQKASYYKLDKKKLGSIMAGSCSSNTEILPTEITGSSPFVYCMMVPWLARPQAQGDIKRFVSTLYHEAFVGEGVASPEQEAKQRLGLVIGFNRLYSIDERRNRLVQRLVAAETETGINLAKIGYFWQLPWTYKGEVLTSDQEMQDMQKWFRAYRKKFPVAAKKFRKEQEKDLRRPIKKRPSCRPYREIRDVVKNHPKTQEMVRKLRTQNSGLQGLYLHFCDDDTESFKTRDGLGLLRASDMRFSQLSRVGKPLPDVHAMGYRVATQRYPHLALSVQLDDQVRRATAKHLPFGVYYPEPNTQVRVLNGSDTVIENFSEDKEDYTSPQEMPTLMKQIMAKRKPADVDRQAYMHDHFVFGQDGYILTCAPKRMVNDFYKGSQNFGAFSEGQDRLLLRWSEDIVTKIRLKTRQSHVNSRSWARNALKNFELRAVTSFSDQQVRLNESEVSTLLISAMSKLFSAYDPTARVQNVPGHNYIEKLRAVIINYEQEIKKGLKSEKIRSKKYKNPDYETVIKAIKSVNTIEKLMEIIGQFFTPEHVVSIHAAAQAAGLAIKETLAANLCFDFDALIDKLIEDSLAEVSPTLELAELSDLNKAAFRGDKKQVSDLVLKNRAAVNRQVTGSFLPIHAAIYYMAEHGYVEGLIKPLCTKDTVETELANQKFVFSLILERVAQPYLLIKEVLQALSDLETPLDAEVGQGFLCLARIATLQERQSPLVAAVRYQPANLQFLEFLITNLKYDVNYGGYTRYGSGWTYPVLQAIELIAFEVVELLSSHQVKFQGLTNSDPLCDHSKEKAYVQTPLIACEDIRSAADRLEMVRLLLENGASANDEDDDEFIPLARAVERDETELALILLANGADPNRCDFNGYHPLEHAFDCGNDQIALALFEAGASLKPETLTHPEATSTDLRRIYCQRYLKSDTVMVEKFQKSGLDLNGDVDEWVFYEDYRRVSADSDDESVGSEYETVANKEQHVSILKILYLGSSCFLEYGSVEEHVKLGVSLDLDMLNLAIEHEDTRLAKLIHEKSPELEVCLSMDFDFERYEKYGSELRTFQALCL